MLFSRQSGAEVDLINQSTNVKKVASTRRAFPEISSRGFSASEQRVLKLLKQEYAKNPRSFDGSVLKYSEGIKESWCADFISWIRFKAGVPYDNPATGHWRIPGVYSLQDYYEASEAYYAVGEYTPKFGDVAFYYGQTPDGNSREHVALVLSVKDGTITTIGGNETEKGIMQIRTNKLKEGERGLTAFGKSYLP